MVEEYTPPYRFQGFVKPKMMNLCQSGCPSVTRKKISTTDEVDEKVFMSSIANLPARKITLYD